MTERKSDFERSISAVRTHLCARAPFFGSLALFAGVKADDQIPTIATNGKDILINRQFFAALTPAEQEGFFLHQVLHAALLHVPRGRGREKERWNIAADIVVNGILDKEGYSLPADSPRDLMLESRTVEEVYDLLQQPYYVSRCFQLTNPDLLTQLSDGSLPTHETSPAQQKILEDFWRNAQEQARIIAETSMHGTLPSYFNREFGAVKASQLNWRHYLWRFLVHTPMDFSGFDRRFIGQRIYLDALEGESVQIVVAVDTSGSIMDEQIRAFLGEVQGILRAYPHLKCDLYFIDTEAHGPHRLTAHSPLPTPVGGGGTDFRPFFEQIERNYDLSAALVGVYLTDGYGEFPETPPRFPLLWVVTAGGLDAEYFRFGEVIRLVN